MAGLDGLRAIAVGVVILYHGNVHWMPAGFLGVDIFFVLSGFLITSLLLSEIGKRGRIDFKRFYIRRARRLLPALFLMLTVVAAVAALTATDLVGGLRHDIAAAFTYVSNWWYIVSQQSYFEAIGRPSPLQHLWSLAVEEQFYLIWPLVMWLALRHTGAGARGRRRLMWLAAGLAAASALTMLVLSLTMSAPVPHDPSRIYYGTDTHSFGLLIGAALAAIWRPNQVRRLGRRGTAAFDLVGFASLGSVLWICWRASDFSTTLYRGGFVWFAVLTAAVVLAATYPGSLLGKLLDLHWLEWIGLRSYGLYLWHWPIFVIGQKAGRIQDSGVLTFLVLVAITVGVAELSYRYVETPIRHGAIGRAIERMRTSRSANPSMRFRPLYIGAASVLVMVVAVTALFSVTPTTLADASGPSVLSGQVTASDPGARPAGPAPSATPTQPAPTSSTTAPESASPQPPAPAPTAPPSQKPSPSPKPAAQTDWTRFVRPAPKTSVRGAPITAYGDSVLIDARSSLAALGNVSIFAEIGRQPWTIADMVTADAQAGKLKGVLVVQAGNNGLLTESKLREILDSTRNLSRVVVVNVSVPRSWQDPNNAVIDQVTRDYPNAVLADWHAVAAGKAEYFAPDAVHLTNAGIRAYTALITAAIG